MTSTESPTLVKISKGLDIPVEGAPRQELHDGPAVSRVALVGRDYTWRKGSILVREGDRVSLGQPLVRDKQIPDIVGTAPGSGVIEAIHRGARRVLETIVVRLEGHEEETFPRYDADAMRKLSASQVRKNLLASGLWTAFRTRPYSTLADPSSTPAAIFITAIDTNPLAPDPGVVINDARDDFATGMSLIAHLSGGKTWVCTAPGTRIPEVPEVIHEVFEGPHPAGLVGTHIHFLSPVNAGRTVWHIGYQDVIAVGRLFTTGRLSVNRVVSLAGPAIKDPRLIRTRVGANTNELIGGELRPGESRVISGSVLSGYQAVGHIAYLGRYHNQVSVLREGRERELFGWLTPGKNRFSSSRAFISGLLKAPRFALTTSQNGSPRAMVPIGSYEQVVPLDTLPTPLLRALVVKDTETAQKLGCLELDEEDLSLCTFVDPGKYDFGPILRENLLQIFKEG